MKKKAILLIQLGLIVLLVVFSGCKGLSDNDSKKSLTFNLSCTPNETNDMDVYIDSFKEDGERNDKQRFVGTINNNELSFSIDMSESTSYVDFLIVRRSSQSVYCYGTMKINNTLNTYNYAGYWFYNYKDYEIHPDHMHYQMVGINKDYFISVDLPISNKFYYNYNDFNSDIFFACKINTKPNGCIKVSYTNNENTQLIVSNNISAFYGQQISSYHKISTSDSGRKVFETDGEPLYVFIRPEHYFDENETALINFQIEDMEERLPNAANIFSVCSYDDKGFYFLKEHEDSSTNNPKATNFLYYYDYSTSKLNQFKEYPEEIVKAVFKNEKVYVACKKNLYLLDLITKTDSLLYTTTDTINDIILIDNDTKLLIAERSGNWKLYDTADFSIPMLESSAWTDFYPMSVNYQMIYFPETKRLVWKENSIYSGIFNLDFSSFSKNNNSFRDTNGNNGNIFRYGNDEKIITGTFSRIFNCETGECLKTIKTEDDYDHVFDYTLFMDQYLFTAKGNIIEKRDYNDPDTIFVKKQIKGETIKDINKESNGNVIVVTNGSRLSNDECEIFVHKFNNNLEEIF